MSEKTMVTIDCDIIISEGTEKVFENQHILLEAGIRCNGKLIFRNCEIEPVATQSVSKGNRRACKPGCIEVSGALQMEGCEVICPGRGFLSGQTITVQNTSFLLVPPYDAIISVSGEAQFEECSFVEKAENTQQTTIGNMIPLCSANIKNCTFDNISGRIDVDTISGCSFTGCASIESVDMTDSTFTDCKSITVNSGCCKNCDFIHVEDVSALSSDVDSCRFQNIENDKEDEGIIFLDDSKMVNCTFDGANLRNSSYLIRGVGDVSVEDCQFVNCYTDREDKKICHCETEERSSASVPMGLLKGALKLAGSAALAATGIAATVARGALTGIGADEVADLAGMAQDKSLEKIRDMWTPDEKKDDAYYEAQAKRAEDRALTARRGAEQFRQRYEKEKKKFEDKH